MVKSRLLWAIVGLFLLITFPLRLREHQSFQIELDQANILQYLWLLANGEAPFSTIVESNMLASHFTPILYLFCLPFRWFPGFELYLLLHLLWMAACGVGVYVLAHRQLESERLAAVCAAAFLFSPLTLGIALYPIPQVASGMAAFIWCLAYDSKPKALLLGVLLAAASLEMALLPFLGLALYLICQKRFKDGIILGVAVTVLILLITQVAIPHFGMEGAHDELDRQFSRYHYLESGIGRLPSVLVTHIAAYWPYDRILLGQMLLGTGALVLLAPAALLLCLPGLVLNLAADFWGMHTIFLHYQATVVGGLYFAVVMGLKKLSPERRKKGAVVLLLGTALSLFLGNPLSGRVGLAPPRVAELEAATRAVPKGESVLAPAVCSTHLCNRKTVYTIPGLNETAGWQDSSARRAEVEWVVLDLTGLGFPHGRDLLNLKAQQILRDPDYGFHSVYGRTVLLQRGNPSPNPPGLESVIPSFTPLELVSAYINGGALESGLEVLKPLLESRPNSPVLLYWEGRYWQEKGDKNRSTEIFQKALEQQPEEALKTEILRCIGVNNSIYTPTFAPRY
jgi:uncharacterized membrane protein